MDHVAIMKASWRLTEQILSGHKTVETRWYKHKVAPWDRIVKGDTVYFKDTGKPVTVKATVSKVEQFEQVDEKLRLKLMKKYLHTDVGDQSLPRQLYQYTQNKPYCLVIHLSDPQAVEPFQIDKKGYGLQAAWLVTASIDDIKVAT